MPPDGDVESLRAAAPGCRGCELWADATEVVFSQGPGRARIMLVGEQPGDAEDREGEPFVGPAGRLLDAALEAAGIARADAYLTNAVRHFRFEERGKRRIHKKPGIVHLRACHPWLAAELAAVAPAVVVALGATAARALLGREVRVTAERGQLLRLPTPHGARPALVTTHPSAVVRLRGKPEFDDAFEAFVADLRGAAAALGS